MTSITHSGVTHTKRITALAPTHKGPAICPDGVNLFALANGGFLIRDPLHAHSYGDREGNSLRTMDAAAFSTLEEALEWLRVNMVRPVQRAETGKAVRS